MMHNHVLRSVRYMLDMSEGQLIEILKTTGTPVSPDVMSRYLKKEDEEGYMEVPDEVMANFLNGLITFKRGKDDRFPAPEVEKRLTNNIMLKKLRVAFELKTEDLIAVLNAADFKVSEGELSAFFRKEGHKNYRPCGDQVLRYFLKGLTAKVRPKKS
ncbi:MAG: DUF1456 family protein [Rahnella inusitata]|jgi:uncharacterized protein YehS (DUF1456 family)|uniref:DUF1456 family protein n=1 Tax=Rahnella inusitata TaxID=58169 RepID=UPI0015DC50DD|nr:DUF1456 family protein [Rahnella inusitata]NMC23559.1 DUF1456 family protein [Serratia sp. (in: enterobacteria)]QLK62249.1 DUF1456 family protein [Enterobacteriaceae bacterium Kacie_13]QUT16495.1 DUF1456 family protein [Rahnella inusitata]